MIFEKFIAFLILIIISPLLLILSCLVYFSDGLPIFFIQERVGKKGKIFKLFKFRTMKKNTPELPTNDFIHSNQFLIKYGKKLRKYSLDELPNLFNIIRGDLSFIGYRPAIKSQIYLNKKRKLYGIYKNKPGITGLAQISGRDNLDDKSKLIYEIKYLNNKSLYLDIRILILTLLMIFYPKNIKSL